ELRALFMMDSDSFFFSLLVGLWNFMNARLTCISAKTIYSFLATAALRATGRGGVRAPKAPARNKDGGIVSQSRESRELRYSCRKKRNQAPPRPFVASLEMESWKIFKAA